MSSYLLSELIEEQIKKIEKIILIHPIDKTDAIDTKKITPEKFLSLYCDKEMTVLKQISQTDLSHSLFQLLHRSSDIIKNLKELKFDEINRLCIYYIIPANCLQCCNKHEESENQSSLIFDLLIQIANFVFSPNENVYSSFIQHNFAILLSAIASFSSSTYKRMFSAINNEFKLGKIQQATLKLFMYMPSKMSLLADFMSEVSLFTKVPPKFYDLFAQMLTETILLAFKRDIPAFVYFLDEGENIFSSEKVKEIISPWCKTNPGVASALIALSFLMPSKLESSNLDPNDDEILDKLKNFPEMRDAKRKLAVKAILAGFRACALSNSHRLIENFMSNYYDVFLTYFLANHNEISHNVELAKYAFVDFPMCVLFKKPQDFKEQILPLYEKPERWLYFSKVVHRVCKQAAIFDSIQRQFNTSFMEVLIEPFVKIFVLSSTKDTSCMAKLLNSVTEYPALFRMLAFQNIANYLQILKAIERNENLPSHFALLKFFDARFADQAKVDVPFIIVYEVTLKFLTSNLSNVALYRWTYLTNSIPDILLLITENMFSLFSGNNIIDDLRSVILHMKTVISNLEQSAIICLASSKEEFRMKGANIISLLVELYHSLYNIADKVGIADKLDLFDIYLFPYEEYREINPHKKLTTACPIIKDALRMIETPDQAQAFAYNSLFSYFLALTKKLEPTIELIEEPITNLTKPDSILNDEWIGTFSVMLSVLPDDLFPKFMKQLLILLKSPSDLGDIAVSAIPTAVAPRYFFSITNMCLHWLSNMKTDQGYVDSKSELSTLMRNLMKLTRGLAEQKSWPTIDSGVIGDLLTLMVMHCDMIPGEDFRLGCAKTTVSFMNLLRSQNENIDFRTRHSISKSFLGWLPTVAKMSKEYNSTIHQALALLLDDLSLIDCIDSTDPKKTEEKANALFMLYFAGIKSRLDMKETTAQDMIPVLAALLKRNMSIGIEHCLSMGFDAKDTVRATFIGAVSAVFHIPEVKSPEPVPVVSLNKSLIDVIFTNDWDFIENLCRLVPYSRAEAFGAAMLEASILRHVEYDFLDRMIYAEINNVEPESKNTLFRGNAVPARVVGYFPRLVGSTWMKRTLRPIFDEVLQNCAKGIHYQVDPTKLEPGDSLEVNQKNFRDLLNKCVNSIVGSIDIMPHSLIREAQLIFNRVSSKYGDFAYQILASFLFLRFLLPGFTIPKLVGLDPVLPDDPKQALLSASNIMNVVTRSKQLNDKGAHLIPFNDFAVEANAKFADFFKKIIKINLNIDELESEDEFKELKLNESDIVNKLRQELWPLLAQIRNLAKQSEISFANPSSNESTIESSPINDENSISSQLTNLADFVQSMGPPAGRGKRSGIGSTCGRRPSFLHDSKQKTESINITKEYNKLMQTEVPDDIQCLLQGFVKKLDEPAPDGSAILILQLDKLYQIKDTKYALFTLFKSIEECDKKIIIVSIIRGFNEQFYPTPSEFEVLSKMPPAQRIKICVCLEPSIEYVSFVQANPSILYPLPHCFPDSLSKLTAITGNSIISNLPESSLESIGKADAVHKAELVLSPSELQEIQVKICPNSIQIYSPTVVVNSLESQSSSPLLQTEALSDTKETGMYSITPVIVIMLPELKFDKPIKMDKKLEFSLYGPKIDVRLRISDTSTLYDTIVEIVRRMQIMKTLSSKVKVDTSTLQWLMLNMAFVNVVNTKYVSSVLKAAIGLINVIFSSFEIKHDVEVLSPQQELPSTLVGYVESLSENIAQNNPEAFAGFLSEYFKVFNYVPKESQQSTLLYVKPWIHLYSSDIDQQQGITKTFFQSFHQLSIISTETFCECIWAPLLNGKGFHAAEVFLRYSLENSIEMFPVISLCFAHLDSKSTTEFIVQKLFTEYASSDQFDETTVKSILDAISLLLAFDEIDQNSMGYLIYNILFLRLNCSDTFLNECCCDIFENSINILASPTKNDWYYEFGRSQLLNSFVTKSTPDSRSFYVNCRIIAKIYQKALSMFNDCEPIFNSLFEKYESDIFNTPNNKENKIKIASSIIYCAAFSKFKGPTKLRNLMTTIMKDNMNDDIILTAVVTAMPLVYTLNNLNEITDAFDAKLLTISINLALRLRLSICADFIFSVLFNIIKRNSNKDRQDVFTGVISCLDHETLEKVEEATGEISLPFSTEPLFSIYIVLSGLFIDNPLFNTNIQSLREICAGTKIENENILIDSFLTTMKSEIKNKQSIKKRTAAIASLIMASISWGHPEITNQTVDILKKRRNEVLPVIQALTSQLKTNLLKCKNNFLWALTQKATPNEYTEDVYQMPSWIKCHFPAYDTEISSSPMPININQFLNVNYKV